MSDRDLIESNVPVVEYYGLNTAKNAHFHGDLTVDGTFNAQSQYNQNIFNIGNYGAIGDGVTDNTVAIQTAMDTASAAKGTLLIPEGNFYSGQIIWKHDVNIIGKGIGRSIITAKNGLNNDLLISENFASETNTDYNSYTTMYACSIKDLTLRGNTANQIIQSVKAEPRDYHYLLKFYGWLPWFENIEFHDCEAALYTEFSNHQPHNPFENYEMFDGMFQTLRAKNYARAGWTFRGPHDSHINNVVLAGGDYDFPDFHFLADNNGNYGGQGTYILDMHAVGTTTATGYDVIVKNALRGEIYAEGSTNSCVLINSDGNDLKFLLGFQDTDNDTTNDAAVVIRADAGQIVQDNTIEAVAYYGPVNGDLVRLENNGDGVSNNTVRTKINNGGTVSGSEFKLVGNVGGNTLISGNGQCGNIWDLTAYSGANNSFVTEGHKYRGGSYFYYLTAFTGNYSADSDYVWVWLDAYPDYERLHIQNFPDSNDGAVTFAEGTRRNYLKGIMPGRLSGYTVIASSTASQAWQDAATYICDGTADDVQINAVITALYTGNIGGKILLSPGTFNLAATINLYDVVSLETATITLEGSGMHATYLKPASNTHAISVGKSTQANILNMAFLLAGSSDGIHDIDGLTSGDGIGWRMRDCQFENIFFSGDNTHTGWGIQIQPFRMRLINIHGQKAFNGSYNYPANGVRLFAASTPNTGATFNSGDSIMKRVHITLAGASGCKALWIDTPDLATGDGSYFNQMTFEQMVFRTNTTGNGTAIQLGHSGSTKIRSLLFNGVNFEGFGVGIDLYNTQSTEFKTFYTSLLGTTNAIYFRTDNTGSGDQTVNNHWNFGGTVGVYGASQIVIQDLNADANNPNIYSNLFVETSGGTAKINGSTSAALPAGVIVMNTSGQQRTGTRHPAFNDPLQPASTISNTPAGTIAATTVQAALNELDTEKAALALPFASKTSTYSITTSDSIIDCTSGTFTVTLPTATGITGRQFTVKNSGAGTITIATTSSQTIDGASTYSLSMQYQSVMLVSNGVNWIVV